MSDMAQTLDQFLGILMHDPEWRSAGLRFMHAAAEKQELANIAMRRKLWPKVPK